MLTCFIKVIHSVKFVKIVKFRTDGMYSSLSYRSVG